MSHTASRAVPSARRRIGWLLFLLLAAGAGLRVWYASGELHVNRFEDERYSLRNVTRILATWDFQPASAYYPSPVFNLPQALALAGSQQLSETLDLPVLGIHGRHGLSKTAFLLTRLYQTLCGVVTLWLAFLIGRRLSSATAGLLAAALLAFMPWMIHASGYNKPDALLVMSVLLSLHAALRAVDATRPWPADRRALRRTVRLWTWAGVCVALAMSAKITGGIAAVPLTVGALMTLDDAQLRLRRIGLLALAGAASALAFVAMNPYWRAYLFFLRGLQRDYAGRTEASRWDVPWQAAALHLEPLLLGPVLGTLALAAFVACGVLLVWRVRNAGRDSGAWAVVPTPTQLAMLLAYPLVYTVAYAAQTPYFKPNNFLPVVPFTVLALACWVDAALRLAADRWPGSGRMLQALVAVAVLAAMVPVGWRYVYLSRVPTTLDVVVAQLNRHLRPAAGHLVWMESWTPPAIPWDGQRALHKGLSTIRQVDDLAALTPEVTELAVALVFVHDGADRGDGDRGDRVETLASAWPATWRWTIEPQWLRIRGPRLEVVLRAADRGEADLEPRACGPGCLDASLPEELAAGEVVSVFVLLPQPASGHELRPRLVIGGRDEALQRTSTQADGALFASPRLRLPDGERQLRIVSETPAAEALDVGAVRIELHRWTPSPNQQAPPDLRK